MKCLEKDRTRRYETASGLARDIEHYLADEPVEACPPSATYRMRRFARRHKGSLAAAAGFMLLLIAGMVASTIEAMRANRAEQQAHDTAQQMQIEHNRARLALTQQVAQRLDGDLRRLAMAGQVLAATLAQRTDWKEADLENWMRTVLGQDERIFGMALAFEPRQFDPNQEDYCIYLFRGLKEIEQKYLLPPSYVPLYREWEWYKKPVQEGRGTVERALCGYRWRRNSHGHLHNADPSRGTTGGRADAGLIGAILRGPARLVGGGELRGQQLRFCD